MKRIITISALLALAFTSGAQTVNDALNISQNNYFGTARTVGMGNAVTAVGGDLGTVGINPAGSAVAGYSQFTITPGLTISSNLASYAPSFADYYMSTPSNALPTTQKFGAESRYQYTRFALPNLGLMMRFDTGRGYGLRAITFGVVSNATNYYTDDYTASGINSGTSITGAFAAFATGNADGMGRCMPGNILTRSDPFASDYYWNYVAAYWGGLINYNMQQGRYFGSAESVSMASGDAEYYVKGELSHRYANRTTGSKNDIVINLGFDINDRVFLGINLGLPTIGYGYTQDIYETAYSDPSTDFVVTPEYIGSDGKYVKGAVTTFDQARYQYAYNLRSSGIYGKFGLIVLPTDNLRIGAAIQTPTSFSLRETWQVREDSYLGSGKHDYSNSPEGNYSYRLRSPYSVNAGLAYTFGTFGMLSVDYEMTDFSIMQYRTERNSWDDNLFRVNRLNQLFCGPSHSVRAGVEAKPIPFLALRAGFSFKSDPTCYYLDQNGAKVDSYVYDAYFDQFESGHYTLVGGKKYNKDNVWAVSAGVGFVSAGSFFADFSVRRTAYPTTYTSMYSCYIDNAEKTVYSPEIRSTRRLWDVLLTFGWRF